MVICCIKSNQWDEWEQIRRWGRVAAEPSAGSHSLTLFSVCQTVVDIIVVAFLMLKLWQQLLPPDTGVQLMIIIFFFVISHIIMREMPTVITQSPMSRFQIALIVWLTIRTANVFDLLPCKTRKSSTSLHQRSWKHETFGILPEKIMKREWWIIKC